jgi:uncharacterized repeat protein (TIGR01451 family)
VLWLGLAALASPAANATARDAETSSHGGPVLESVLARWRCNIPECSGPDWTGAVIDWPSWAAHHSNARAGDKSRSVFSLDDEPVYPYMGSWADGCEVTAVTGVVLIIEWQRGTNVWRETWLGPGQTHVIDLVWPEDGAMIETSDDSPGFSVTLEDCNPRPIYHADLAITITDGQSTATPGMPVVYTITVENAGPHTLSEVALIGTLPAALLSPVFTPASGSYQAGSGAWTGIHLPPGGSVSMTLAGTMSPAATGTLVNGVTVGTGPYVADPDPTNNGASDVDTLAPSADLAITKNGPALVTAGGEVTYMIAVTNNGPSDAASVEVSDATPSGLTLVSNDCANVFPCGLGAMTAGETRTLTSTYTIGADHAGPTLSNTATVTATTSDPVGANDSSTAISTVVSTADLGITMTGPATVTPGHELTYTITVTNDGPSDAALVEVADATPAGLTFVSNDGACASAFPCALGLIGAGETRRITATFSLPADHAGQDPVDNVASVASATADPDFANNSATVSTGLVGYAFFTLAPCRLLDTREAAHAPPLRPGPARFFPIVGACGVPGTARAVSINVTVTDATDPGDLRLYPAGVPAPLASAVNYGPRRSRASNGIVKLGEGGGLEVLCGQAAGTVHFVLDVNGYFE